VIVAFEKVQKSMVRTIHRPVKREQDRTSRRVHSAQGNQSDPVLALLEAAPIDDESVTEDDERHIAEGWQAYREGKIVSAEGAKLECHGAIEGESARVEDRKAPS
jgi:hypothetical protein